MKRDIRERLKTEVLLGDGALGTLLDSLLATERPAALDGGMKLLWRHLLHERAARG